MIEKHKFLLSVKSNEVTFFKERIQAVTVLVIRYLNINVTVPLQLLVTANQSNENVTVLVTIKGN